MAVYESASLVYKQAQKPGVHFQHGCQFTTVIGSRSSGIFALNPNALP